MSLSKQECIDELRKGFEQVFLAICPDGRMSEEGWDEMMRKTGSDTAWSDVVEALEEMAGSDEEKVRAAVGEVDTAAGMTAAQYVALNTHQFDAIPDLPFTQQVYPEVKEDFDAAIRAVS